MLESARLRWGGCGSHGESEGALSAPSQKTKIRRTDHLLDNDLRDHPRVILTDHVAWYSEEAQAQLQQTAAEELVRVCTGGLPRSLMNPEVLRRLGRFAEWTPSATVRWQLKRLEGLTGAIPRGVNSSP